MQPKKLLMISTDRLIFDEKSEVCARQIENAKKWDEVYIIVFAKKNIVPLAETELSRNCRAYSTKSSFKINYPFDAIKLGRKIIQKYGVANITCQDSSLTAMVGVALKKEFNIPLEIQIHTDIGSPYFTRLLGQNIVQATTNRIRLILAKKYLPKSDNIRVVSERIKKYIESILVKKCGAKCDHQSGCDRKSGGCCESVCDRQLGRSCESGCNHPSIEVRPIYVDIEFIKNALVMINLHNKYPQFTKIALMASRLEKEKNIEMAIKAWSKVVSRIPKACLIIVGRGSEKTSLESLIVKLNLTQNIFIEKWTDKTTLISYYKTADVFLNTSYFEGYGMTLVEAKAAGCPIISTDVGVAREIGARIIKNEADTLTYEIINFFESHD